MKALRRSSTSSSSSASSSPRAPSSPPPWVHLRSLLVASSSSSLATSGNSAAVAASASFSPASYSPHSDRGGTKSPWSRRKRKRPLSCRHWNHLFSANGKLRDGGRKFLKKVRSGGVEPDIRAKVWPFLLGVYDLNSSEAERNVIKTNKRNDYEKLRLLEAYALYDPEIGYCQGMSDLLSPIIVVMEEDHEAFWCFVGFMRKARHNFRLDEVGIRRQLKIVSQIIKRKDSHLYRHLQKLQAEDCFFVYRMVVVLFRRELTFEQTLCLWEVMWADQAAIRAGIGRSTWAKIRLHAPPTDDLLLYAIAASVLQRRKLIIERYSSMDEILRECNSMAGQLDVWKLLDDAHDLVVNLHDKI
ncbi:hypothetical protein E2562_007161 [Oryza meyeriana var. granulata]|uniref:Rab-GAP TBC domain-containing protein n=1 Tax=Oryza meyeriana var. granulata TaxID=110450 RepID=A0A6G1CDP4_9ORYZ|nr:hypothetical protein E2562_007161 [Oryza meyeriana var. granulata]